MRTLELPAGATPRKWGHIHGESFRGEIKALAAIRTYLCTKVGGFANNRQVLAAARAHLPILEVYDRDLYDELLGIAEGSMMRPEDIVIANHYTDLRDLDPDPSRWMQAPTRDDPDGGAAGRKTRDLKPFPKEDAGDGCTMLWAESATGRILAQTWDMHATAIPYVMMLGVPESAMGPAGRYLTVTGCLGMCGMSTARVGIAINNLFSTDATLGVVWPAMVRKALRETTADAARGVIASSPIGSGHHYFIADRERAFALETSGLRRKQIFAGEKKSYAHTNHCLDREIDACSKVPAASTTHDRLRWLDADIARAPIADLDDAWKRLGSEDGWPRSICTNMATPEAPHGVATCGAVAMNLDSGDFWAQQGFIHNVAAEKCKL